MQTRHLKTLVKIAQVQSFATAASQLNITLPTLSMQMKTLEEELSTSLFDRSWRPPKLTPAGRRIAGEAQTVLAAEAAMLEACSDGNELSGNYRIGFVATASVRLLPRFLKNAAEAAPNIQFDIETGLSEAIEAKVLSGQLDVGVVTASRSAEAGLRYDVLSREALLYAIPSGFEDSSLKVLAGQLPFIQFDPSSGIGKLIARHVGKLGSRKTRKTIVLDSVEAIMECVNVGLGFTMLSEPDIKRYAIDDVRIFEPAGSNLNRQLALVTADSDAGNRIADLLPGLFDG